MGHSSQNLDLSDHDIGLKVYEIKEEKTIAIAWKVKAKNKYEAFDKWLSCSDSDKTMENMKVRDNGDDVICTFAKEYSELIEHGKELGTIKKSNSDDEDSELEVV